MKEITGINSMLYLFSSICWTLFQTTPYFIVNMKELQLPLTNTQLEILKLYATELSEQDLQELRGILADFYAKKSIQKADQLWNEQGLSNEDMDQWLNED